MKRKEEEEEGQFLCSPTVLVHRVIAVLRHRKPRVRGRTMMAHRPRRDGLGGETGRTAQQGERHASQRPSRVRVSLCHFQGQARVGGDG